LRLFITGVAGFAGGHLLEHLAELEGYEAHGADHAPLTAHPNANALERGLASYRALDITNAEAVDSWLASAKPDALIHLAAQASGADALERPVPTYDVNVMGTLHVLEAVRRRAPSTRVLVTGSADVYGSGVAGGRITEEAPLRPANPYAGSKAAQRPSSFRSSGRARSRTRVRGRDRASRSRDSRTSSRGSTPGSRLRRSGSAIWT
jgi:nucleoside-diphosphate-sugar epimerase